jgi:hypothetical protein
LKAASVVHRSSFIVHRSEFISIFIDQRDLALAFLCLEIARASMRDDTQNHFKKPRQIENTKK